MTREEAINYFERSIVIGDTYVERQHNEALKMAIKALEQEPILDKIRAEIMDWQTDIHDNEHDAESHDFVFERIYEIIDEYKEREK
jgi:hypothetical protein